MILTANASMPRIAKIDKVKAEVFKMSAGGNSFL